MLASKEDYKKALLKLRDNKKLRNTKYLDILRAQYAAKEHTITATQLAEKVNYTNFNTVNLQYGTLGHEISDLLGYKPPVRKNGEFIWFWILSSGNDACENTIDGHYEFVMRPELVAALEEMKWVNK